MTTENTADDPALPPLLGSPDDFWTATESWIQAVEKRYDGCDRGDLTQIFMRGPFAGMSEREVACFADRLRESTEKFPLHRKANDAPEPRAPQLVAAASTGSALPDQTPWNYPLFRLMADEHGLTLTDDDLNQIINTVRAMDQPNKQL